MFLAMRGEKEPFWNTKKRKYKGMNATDKLISRLDTDEERISELEEMTTESSKKKSFFWKSVEDKNMNEEQGK